MIHKNLLLTANQKEMAVTEVKFHKLCQHENIVQLFDTIETGTGYEIYMEYC